MGGTQLWRRVCRLLPSQLSPAKPPGPHRSELCRTFQNTRTACHSRCTPGEDSTRCRSTEVRAQEQKCNPVDNFWDNPKVCRTGQQYVSDSFPPSRRYWGVYLVRSRFKCIPGIGCTSELHDGIPVPPPPRITGGIRKKNRLTSTSAV